MKQFTDKWGKLLEYYRDQPIDYLEIGLYKGESLPLWYNYFGTNCNIHGIDLDLSLISIDSRFNFKFYEMNALDQSKFNLYFKDKQFDVIVDDANPFQHASVFDLYSKLLKPGGTYIIETYKCSAQYYKDFTYIKNQNKWKIEMMNSNLSFGKAFNIKHQ